MENPIKMDDLGVPLFLETSISSPEHCPFQCPSKVAPSSGSSDAPNGDGEPWLRSPQSHQVVSATFFQPLPKIYTNNQPVLVV